MRRVSGVNSSNLVVVVAAVLLAGGGAGVALADNPCGSTVYPFPYTDVASISDAFCPGIMQAYVTAISRGTTATTFSPTTTVTRVQMTTFLQRELDQALRRAHQRVAMRKNWVVHSDYLRQQVATGSLPVGCDTDGADVWVGGEFGSTVTRLHASDGAVLGTWTGVPSAAHVLAVGGKVFVTGYSSPGRLFMIDPTAAPGAATLVAELGAYSDGIAFDGTSIWTANQNGSISIVTPQATAPFPVTTVTTGFSMPNGIVYDGTFMWVTDRNLGALLKVDLAGVIVQTVSTGPGASYPAFDGINIWVPNSTDNSVTVVQASTGAVVVNLAATAVNGFNSPIAAAFDGERILISNYAGNSLTMLNPGTLSVLANVPIGSGSGPMLACSDGLGFWVTLSGKGTVMRF
jgi:hypothetical protein